MSFNKVILQGNLTRDPEMRYLESGTAVCNLGVAVNRKWKDAGGETREEVTFVDCEAWGKTAETIQKFFGKGGSILIDGRLKLDQWEKDGEKRSKMKVVVETFAFCGDSKGPNREGEGEGEGRAPAAGTRTVGGGKRPFNPPGGRPAAAPAPEPYGDPDEDNIPF